MAKILLVEDDNNLREIYEARLQAEGYTIVSAKDGEEALVVAKAEKPDLIISDVMMPKISGFEMLDILRNTDGLRDTKVIMLTALGQAEDQTRANRLGADRYLVKSQVTLEDIVKVSKDLLSSETAVQTAPIGDSPAESTDSSSDNPAPEATPEAPTPAPDNSVPPPAEPAPAVTSIPVTSPDNTPPPAPAGDQPPANDSQKGQSEAEEKSSIDQQIQDFINNPANTQPAPETLTGEQASDPQAQSPNDQALSNAEDKLVESTVEQETTTNPINNEGATLTPPAPPPPSQASTAEPAASEESQVPPHKERVIEPLESPPQKSLQELMAEEEAKQITPSEDIPSGGAVKSEPNQFNPDDPNNIAL